MLQTLKLSIENGKMKIDTNLRFILAMLVKKTRKNIHLTITQ